MTQTAIDQLQAKISAIYHGKEEGDIRALLAELNALTYEQDKAELAKRGIAL